MYKLVKLFNLYVPTVPAQLNVKYQRSQSKNKYIQSVGKFEKFSVNYTFVQNGKSEENDEKNGKLISFFHSLLDRPVSSGSKF